MAAKCEFGGRTDSLIMDTFIQIMNNKMVQQNLCTEPKKNPEEAFRFAVAYEEGVNQHKAFEATTGTKEIKQDPIKKPKSSNVRGRGRIPARVGLRRINTIEQDDSQSESSNEMNEETMVLHLSGAGNKSFVLKGKINKEPFKTMINSGSLITIFTQEDPRKILKVDVMFTRPVPKNE